MNKLRLDDLAVESFDTTADREKERGTVFGEQQCTCYTVCTCPGCPTCAYASCMSNCNTCAASCWGTCDASCEYGTCRGQATCGGGDTCWDSCDTACGTYFCV
ncbi:MAG TPA: hypothetical protein VF006_01120 [Longimicrobium sp.]